MLRWGTRVQSDAIGSIEVAVEREQGLGPQLAQERDLLVEALAPGGEVLPQHFVLDIVPPRPDAERESAVREQIEVRSLSGDERGLSLRQDQHPRRELDPLCDRGGIGE